MPELTVVAPDGSHFEFEEVKTAKGTQSLGEVPMLVWDSLPALEAHIGSEGVLAVADGTSLRVSYQGIARRNKAAGKSNDDIAKTMTEFKPGKRVVGQSTPASRAASNAKKAVEKTGNAEAIEKLLARIASGEISLDALAEQIG